MRARIAIALAAISLVGAGALAAPPAPAQALDITKPICTLTGLISTLAGRLCSAARDPGRVLGAGKKLLGGHLGGAVETLTGAGTAVRAVGAGAVLAAIVGWVRGGARSVLAATAKVIADSTRPQLTSTWFSASYWRMAGIAALLTLPFLFAAAAQAVLRSDPGLLARSVFVYLPLGLLSVSIAAPLTTLLLSASDSLSALISGATADGPGLALAKFAGGSGALGVASGSTFVVFFIGLLTVAATITLWVELLIREAAVYVVVLMLPLFFAALVWPARRVWAVGAIEVLVALILSKFAIVAVLSLGAAAIGHSAILGVTGSLAGATLVLLAAFSPWALLRLLPLHELASGLDGLRTHARPVTLGTGPAESATDIANAMVGRLTAQAGPPSSPPDGGDGGGRGTDGGTAEAIARGHVSDGAERGNGPAESTPTLVAGLAAVDRPAAVETPASSDGVTPVLHQAGAPGPAGVAGTLGPPGESRPPGESGAPSGVEASAASDAGGAPERLPGLERRWQARNNEWETLVLGPDMPRPDDAEEKP